MPQADRPGFPIPRDRLLAFIYLLLALNALPPFIGEAVRSSGWLMASLNLFDVSAIVWIAAAAGLTLSWQGASPALASRFDLALAGGAVLAALLPIPPVSGAALSVVAFMAFLSAEAHSARRRAAAIFLGLSTFLFWGRILLAVGSGPLLSADAWFVSQVSGMAANGNVVDFANGRNFVIAPGCSSLHGISLALILWTTAISWFDLRLTRRRILTLLAAIAGSILANCLRLTMIALHPDNFGYWHTGTGAELFGWLALIVLAGIVYSGLAGRSRAA